MGRALQDLLGITEPIVLGPFGGASSIELTALVSEAGGLGSYGLYGYTPDRIRETIASLRAATARPFAVNLWLPTGDEVAPADLDLRPYLEALAPLYEEVGVEPPTPPAAFLPPFEAQFEAVLDAAPAVVSFVYGVPAPDDSRPRPSSRQPCPRDSDDRSGGWSARCGRCGRDRGERLGGGGPPGVVPAAR